VVLNCPGNPGGAVLGVEELQKLVDMARRHDVWILSDEVYDEIVFEGPFRSPAELAPERTIQVMSFAKTYAMTGWRLGYLAAPPDRIPSLAALAMGVWSSVAEPLQYAGIAALEGPDDAVRAARARYHARRDRVISWCERAGVATSHPAGAFYLLVDVSAVDSDSRRFAFHFLERDGVAVAPGSAFGAVEDASVRISIAAPDDVLDAGIERLLHRLATGF
jgi:aspartate/methionine/tyrosine aminotransferase